MNAKEYYCKQFTINKEKEEKDVLYTKNDMIKFAANYHLYKKISMEDVEEDEEDKIETTEQVITRAKNAVELITGVTFTMMNDSTRQRTIVYPKYMFYTLLKRYSNLKLTDISKLFYRKSWNPVLKKTVFCHPHHSSIISGLKNIEDIEYMGKIDEWYHTWESVHKTFLTTNLKEETTSQG
jgi:hypothetical protein